MGGRINISATLDNTFDFVDKHGALVLSFSENAFSGFFAFHNFEILRDKEYECNLRRPTATAALSSNNSTQESDTSKFEFSIKEQVLKSLQRASL